MIMETLKICLVDDDRDDRNLFRKAFDELGSQHQLVIFNSGFELMEYLNDETTELPDILFLDLNMPNFHGQDVLEEIRKNELYNPLSIAIYSTSSSEQHIEDALSAGANIYVIKPNDFEVLKDSIRKSLKINWQYHNSELDRENFLLVI